MLVLLYMPNGPKDITITGAFTTSTTLGGIIYFYIINFRSTITLVVDVLYSEV